MFGKKPPEDSCEYADPITVHVDNPDARTDAKKAVEKVMSDSLDMFFITNNPHDGEPLAVIRLTDLYRILCKNLNVDPEETEYSSYAN